MTFDYLFAGFDYIVQFVSSLLETFVCGFFWASLSLFEILFATLLCANIHYKYIYKYIVSSMGGGRLFGRCCEFVGLASFRRRTKNMNCHFWFSLFIHRSDFLPISLWIKIVQFFSVIFPVVNGLKK